MIKQTHQSSNKYIQYRKCKICLQQTLGILVFLSVMLQTSQVFIHMGQYVKFSYLFAQKHAGNFEEISLAGTVQ